MKLLRNWGEVMKQIKEKDIVGKVFKVTQEYIDYYNNNCDLGECEAKIGDSYEIIKWRRSEGIANCGIDGTGRWDVSILNLFGIQLVK